MKRSNSEKLFETAKNYFPGGVNSPVRAFKAVEGAPLFRMRMIINLSISVVVLGH